MNFKKEKNQNLFDKESYEIPNILFNKEYKNDYR